MRRAGRAAFSLIEVLLAMSILFGSLIVLGHLANIGRQHADDAEKLTAAQLICQTKLNEILAGATPATSVQDRAVDDAPGWAYSVEVQSVDQSGLASLRVTVKEDVSDLEESMEGRPVKEFSLVRWIRDPYRQDRGRSPSGSDAPEPSPFDEIVRGESF
jgi:Tfp pilus assembly protein PilV